MRNTLNVGVIAISLLFASCGNLKLVRTSELEVLKEKKEVHHYHDSTHVIERLEMKPVVIPGDSSFFKFTMKELEKLGKIKHTSGRITTRVEVDSSGYIAVYSSVDSLIHLVEQLTRETYHLQSKIESVLDHSSSTSIESESKKKTGIFSSLNFFLFLIITLLCSGAFIYWKWFR